MAAASTRVTLTVRDRFLNEARIIFHVAAGIIDPNNAVIQAIVSAINAAINPVGIYVELTQVNAVTATATSGADYVAEDKVIFPAIDEDGQPHNFKVPAPIPTIFLDDGYNVDVTNADVVAYIGAVKDNAVGRNAVEITVLTTGYRWASRKALKA